MDHILKEEHGRKGEYCPTENAIALAEKSGKANGELS
jgi:hypothetical protein